MTTASNTIIEKIRALRARTEAAGCTEDEAMQAASMIARLMSKHDLTDSDITEAERTGAGLGSDMAAQRNKHRDDAMDYVVPAIARLTETRIVIQRKVSQAWRGRKVTGSYFEVFGMDADREMATYLMEVIRSAATRGWNEHSKATGQKGNAARTAFRLGVYTRVAIRINEIAQEREDERKAQQAATKTGNALVVRKEDLVNSLLPAGIRQQQSRRRTVDAEAFHAGRSYGGIVGLGRPVEGARRTAGEIA